MAAPEKEGEAQKLRFGQWLLNAINSGRYPGLRWIDSARTTFRVPWKHNARKDITSTDVEVFKAWAKVSGRYEEGSEDPAKWKTNFRCALSSTHLFKLEQDNSKRGDDPHKVFSIVSANFQPSKEGDSSILNPVVDRQAAQQQLQLELHPQDMASAIAVPGSTDSIQLSVLEDLLQQCGISPHDPGSLDPSWVPAGDFPAGDTSHQDTLLQPYADTGQNGCFPPTTFPQWVPTVEQPALDTYQPSGLLAPEETGGCRGAGSGPGSGNATVGWEEARVVPQAPMPKQPPAAACGTVMPMLSSPAAGAVPPPGHLTEGAVPVQYAAEGTLFLPAASPVPQPQPLLDSTDDILSILDVTIYYRGREFHREVVGSRCLLTYQPRSLPAARCPWHVVHFPSPAGLADGKQRRMTEELLGIAGLRLERRAFKVFATRWEKCRVFWALSQQLEGAEEPPPNLLCRDQETPIFDFNEFCTELRDFRSGQRRRSPDFTIYLCFGQAFSKAKPKESKLILVKLVPKFCEYYYEQVLQEGASSLNSRSISLQLSNSFDLMELIEQYNMQLG